MTDPAATPLTTTALLIEAAERADAGAAVAIPDSFGGWFDLTAAEFFDRVTALAKGFVARGLQPGDRLGLLCSVRYEATLIEAATALVGIATVPLRAQAAEAEMQRVLEHAEVRAVIVETAGDFARFDEIHGDLPLVDDVWQIGLAGLDKLVHAGRSVDDADLAAVTAQVTAETPLALHYWSTADGLARVSVLRHGPVTARVRALADVLAEATGPEASTLLVLPATDVHSRLTSLLALSTGTRLGHLGSRATLLDTVASFRPTLLVAEPETFAGIDEAARLRAELSGFAPALRQSLEVADDYARALDGESVPTWLKTRFALADALVLRGLRKAAGGRLRFGVSLSADQALPAGLRRLMRALDARALESFGTPETSGFATIESPADPFERPTGSVGAALAGVTVEVARGGAGSSDVGPGSGAESDTHNASDTDSDTDTDEVRMLGPGIEAAADPQTADLATVLGASSRPPVLVGLGLSGSLDAAGRLRLAGRGALGGGDASLDDADALDADALDDGALDDTFDDSAALDDADHAGLDEADVEGATLDDLAGGR